MPAKFLIIWLTAFIFTAGLAEQSLAQGENNMNRKKYEKATFGGGCFWCMQPPFDAAEGVISTRVGYCGGKWENPTYEEVCSGETGHAEAVEVIYDPSVISYRELLDIFWRNIDPTAVNRQFADVGSQYRTVIFYHHEEQKIAAEESKKKLDESGKFDNPVVTAIEPASAFYEAEEYHQDYYLKNSIHYQRYKIGSGRDGYLKKTWGNKK